MPNPLIDKEFLKKLDEFPLREIYVRIIALTFDEHPIDEIQGRATAGSINIDGDSAVRRTCSLTLSADNLDTRDYYWGLKNKFKLEVGMKNFVDVKYGDIIWFPQGIFLITSFNTSETPTGYTINIQGKDKMALLNGDIGGKIHANSTRFDILEEYDEDGNRTEIKIPIRELVAEIVHEYGNEPFHNIIINDVDEFGLELLEFRGKEDLYFGLDPASRQVKSIRLGTDWPFFYDATGGFIFSQISDKINYDTFNINSSIGQEILQGKTPTQLLMSRDTKSVATIAKVSYGQTAGYRETELIYPDELVVSSGETVTGVLDKIKTFLNDFEYFYDLDGRFIFQRKPIYTIRTWTPLKKDGIEDKYGRSENFVESMMDVSPIAYQFQDNKLLMNISNNPNFSNIKNDFSIWGKRQTLSGAERPIHLRYAIQKKPRCYRKFSDNVAGDDFVHNGDIFFSTETTLEERREFLKDLPRTFIMPASETGSTSMVRYIGYQIWVVDWRELIYQMALDYRRLNHDADYEVRLLKHNPWIKNEKTLFEQYYVDMEAFWRQLYTLQFNIDIHPIFDIDNITAVAEMGQWAPEIASNPETLDFWFDFLDTSGDMSKYSVNAIGDRAQVVNDDKIKAVFYQDTPLVIYYNGEAEDRLNQNRSKTGYTYIQMNGLESLFSISSQGKSTKDELDNQLQNFTYASQTVSLTSIPVYYLQPNTRIEITNNENLDVNGEYIVSKITIPLAYNGTMSITAIKDNQTIL